MDKLVDSSRFGQEILSHDWLLRVFLSLHKGAERQGEEEQQVLYNQSTDTQLLLSFFLAFGLSWSRDLWLVT